MERALRGVRAGLLLRSLETTPMTQTVDRRENLSLEEFQETYASKGQPVILTDLTNDWNARHWTPDYLVEKAGDAWIEAQPTVSHPDSSKVEMTVSEYVDYLKKPDDRKLYLTSWTFREDCPELSEDFEVPEFFRDDWMLDVSEQVRPDLMWIFLGPADSGLYLHSDVANTSAWNAQLSGSKEWKLYPPEQAEFMYDGEVDVFNPDLKKFPDFAQAEAVECTVGPGECLYVPWKWWHQTRNVEEGMALTANFADQYCCEDVLEWLEGQPLYNLLFRNFRRAVRKRKRRKRG